MKRKKIERTDRSRDKFLPATDSHRLKDVKNFGTSNKPWRKKQQTTHIVRYLIRGTSDAPQTAIYHKLIHAYAVLHIINYLIS